jgi:hypothetical protein
MTPEYRLTLIIETIRAIRIGTPVSKGLVRHLLEPWPDLYWEAMDRNGLDQSASGSRRPDRARPGVTNATAPTASRPYVRV